MESGAYSFLNRRPVQILTVLLLLQAVLYYTKVNTPEYRPLSQPLAQFPTVVDNWRLLQEGVVEQETKDVLKADDLLTRVYGSPGYLQSNLFIAYYRSQRTGRAPHSPKNCLPGSGWNQIHSGTSNITLLNGRQIEVNRYLVARGENKSLVLYWYQSHNRVVASEYEAKIHLVLDSIRLNRSDTSLVRVVVPVIGDDAAASDRAATNFIQSIFPSLDAYFPE